MAQTVPDEEIPSYVACGVEGCPRIDEKGQEEMCGLAKIYGVGKAPEVPECGATRTIDLWERLGCFDDD